MKSYERFKNAIMISKQKNYEELRKEVKTVERAIECFLSKALECSSSMAEKDFFVSPL